MKVLTSPRIPSFGVFQGDYNLDPETVGGVVFGVSFWGVSCLGGGFRVSDWGRVHIWGDGGDFLQTWFGGMKTGHGNWQYAIKKKRSLRFTTNNPQPALQIFNKDGHVGSAITVSIMPTKLAEFFVLECWPVIPCRKLIKFGANEVLFSRPWVFAVHIPDTPKDLEIPPPPKKHDTSTIWGL